MNLYIEITKGKRFPLMEAACLRLFVCEDHALSAEWDGYAVQESGFSNQNRHDAGYITDQLMKVPLLCGRDRSFAEGLSE